MKSRAMGLVALGLIVATIFPEVTQAQDDLSEPYQTPASTPAASAVASGKLELEFVVGKSADKDSLVTAMRELGRLDLDAQVTVSVVNSRQPDSLMADLRMIDRVSNAEVQQVLDVLENSGISVHVRQNGPGRRVSSATDAAHFGDPVVGQLDQTIWSIAQAIADARVGLGPRHPKVLQLETRLRSSVTAAFETRQRAQRGHLQRLKEQHARIQTHIENREKNKQQIIDQRVAEILKSGGVVATAPVAESGNSATAAAAPKTKKAPSADALKLFELQERRWELGLQAFQSGNATTEELIAMTNELYEAGRGAAKDAAEIDIAFQNHLKKLETIREFAEERYKNGVEPQSALLSAEVALLKARLAQ